MGPVLPPLEIDACAQVQIFSVVERTERCRLTGGLARRVGQASVCAFSCCSLPVRWHERKTRLSTRSIRFGPNGLPKKWSTQQFVNIDVSKSDHIWAINRRTDARPDELGAAMNPPQGECCVLGPEILEFDTDGNVLKAWGEPNYVPGWPGRLQTLAVDQEENIWLSGTRPGDSVIEFTGEGKFLWDLGHRGPKSSIQGTTTEIRERIQNNQQTDTFLGGIDAFDIDENAKELYITDGGPNKRVLVYDTKTGAFKRGWGGHGMPLSEIDNDPPPPYDISGPPPDLQEFVPTLHCIHISSDGLVYVCERGSDRIQVFTKTGKFVTSYFVHPSTPARGQSCGGIWHATLPMCGTVFNLTFSHDPQQKYLLVADGTKDTNNKNTPKTFFRIGSETLSARTAPK